MAYPRRCLVCLAHYGTNDYYHATIRAEPGGTPSPWHPELPGRLLTLRCRLCGGEFAWDYFADAERWLLQQRQGQQVAHA